MVKERAHQMMATTTKIPHKGKVYNVNVKWFKDQIARKGLSQRKVAAMMGINQAVITFMFNGTRELPIEEAIKWAEILEVSLEEVISHAGLDVSKIQSGPASVGVKGVKVEGYVDGKLIIQTDLKNLLGSPVAPEVPGSNIKCVRCQTSGSPFEGMDGALLYYRDANSFDPDALSRMCVVRVKGEENFMVRIVKRGYEAGKHNLVLPNGEVSRESVVLDVATPILWMKL